jgi:putative FmdB family regulatory protein
MPIYEYACTACDHRTDILHGINDPGPHFCPSCGREGTMRKLFAPPTIHYKGSGWAKKDRGGSSTRARSSGGSSSGDESKGDGGSSASTGSTATTSSSEKPSGDRSSSGSGSTGSGTD